MRQGFTSAKWGEAPNERRRKYCATTTPRRPELIGQAAQRRAVADTLEGLLGPRAVPAAVRFPLSVQCDLSTPLY